MQLAYQIGKIGQALREKSPKKHLLESLASRVWEGTLKVMIEPVQAVASEFASCFESAMLVGDVVRISGYIFLSDHNCTAASTVYLTIYIF